MKQGGLVLLAVPPDPPCEDRERVPRGEFACLVGSARPPREAIACHREAFSIASWTWFNRLVRRLDDPRDGSSQVQRGGLTPNAMGHGSPRVPGRRSSLGVSARHARIVRPPREASGRVPRGSSTGETRSARPPHEESSPSARTTSDLRRYQFRWQAATMRGQSSPARSTCRGLFGLSRVPRRWGDRLDRAAFGGSRPICDRSSREFERPPR